MQQQDAAGLQLAGHPRGDFFGTKSLPVQCVQIPLDGDAAGAVDALDDRIIVAAGRRAQQNRPDPAGLLDVLAGGGDLL